MRAYDGTTWTTSCDEKLTQQTKMQDYRLETIDNGQQRQDRTDNGQLDNGSYALIISCMFPLI